MKDIFSEYESETQSESHWVNGEEDNRLRPIWGPADGIRRAEYEYQGNNLGFYGYSEE